MFDSDPKELAWAAGLFEGEGSFMLKKHSPSLKNKQGYQFPAAALAMTDEDTVRRFVAAVGVGTVRGPHTPRNGRKPLWTWQVSTFESVQHVVAIIWFGLGERRRAKAIEVLTAPHGRTTNLDKSEHELRSVPRPR